MKKNKIKLIAVFFVVLAGVGVIIATVKRVQEAVQYKPQAEEAIDRCSLDIEVIEDAPPPTVTPSPQPTNTPTPTAEPQTPAVSCTVSKSGNTVSASGNGAIRLWLQKEDGTKIEGITFGTERTISGHYYYELANPADLGSLSSGNYYISCDADISSDHGCSGNPACSWERNLRPEDCSSFPQIQKSCSENDNLSF